MSFDWLEQLKIRTYILIIMEIISFLSGGGEVGLKSLSWNYFFGGIQESLPVMDDNKNRATFFSKHWNICLKGKKGYQIFTACNVNT